MKRLIPVVLIVVIVIGLSGCDTILPYGRIYNIFPQHNTNWQTKDGTMSIHIEENGVGRLIVDFNGEQHEYELHGLYATMNAYDEEGKLSEEWYAFYHRNWFSAKIHDSDYFEEGTKIKFYRVDEDGE